MSRNVTPMIHVPDVRRTVEWYESIGFVVENVAHDDGVVVWAAMTFGRGRVMFNAGGRESPADRREMDLYVDTDGVDALYRRLEHRVEIREGPHDTFYGMRELIIRDLNGFWVTFGEPVDRPGSGAGGEP